MRLTHLAVTDFRLYARLDMDFTGRVVLLVGGNAQGKSSLLEAIYYLTAFTSYQAESDRQLINFNAARECLAVARLVADYERKKHNHHLEVRLIQETNGAGTPPRFRREFMLDGIKKSSADLVGHFNSVIFLPIMMRIIENGPEERRRYLNLAIGQTSPGYSRALVDYSQALTQRNALLKQLSERGGDPDQLAAWDEILTRSGAQIMMARITALDELERVVRKVHHRLTGNSEVLRLAYQPAFDPLAVNSSQLGLPIDTLVDRSGLKEVDIQNGFSNRLVELRREEIARGVTTIGPHRDELRFLANGIDLTSYGSRGQVRTALLALKLAEVEWMRGRTGEQPVLLLDEILAELDQSRRSDLLDALSDGEQAILATNDLALFKPDFVQAATCWHVAGGVLTAADSTAI
ncbi:MAG: DNA replication and repair protein RecF [Anaerolineaceae bacterium]|nr:DNA replication and repair protein RecF [Anaerolineaceae bacterium]MBN2678219.1 DNA replication and repair protein RecF [Anaerolineaceae bacterium]